MSIEDYYLYSDINNPETSKVTYVGGYKFDPTSMLDMGNSTLSFGGITFPLSSEPVGNVYGFTYNKYKIELPLIVNYTMSTPTVTNKVEFSGVSSTTNENVYMKLFNKNQLHRDYKFEFSYETTPTDTEIDGLLFNFSNYSNKDSNNNDITPGRQQASQF